MELISCVVKDAEEGVLPLSDGGVPYRLSTLDTSKATFVSHAPSEGQELICSDEHSDATSAGDGEWSGRPIEYLADVSKHQVRNKMKIKTNVVVKIISISSYIWDFHEVQPFAEFKEEISI